MDGKTIAYSQMRRCFALPHRPIVTHSHNSMTKAFPSVVLSMFTRHPYGTALRFPSISASDVTMTGLSPSELKREQAPCCSQSHVESLRLEPRAMPSSCVA